MSHILYDLFYVPHGSCPHLIEKYLVQWCYSDHLLVHQAFKDFISNYFQLINFVYGLPQLFQIIPCPRHRLPRFDSKTGLRTMSTAKFKFSSLHPLGQLWVRVGTTLGLIWSRECDDGMMEINNLTNLNLTLKFTGPISERNLTVVLLLEQVLGCFLALAIRYQLSHLLY